MIKYILVLFLIVYSSQSNCATITSLQLFKEAVNNAHDPVCVFIVADWCSICKEIKPHIQTIMNNPEINSKIDFIHVSFDAIPELATEFDVTKVPTFCLFNKDGKLVDRIEGVKNVDNTEQFLTEKITQFLAKTSPQQPHYLKQYIPKTDEAKDWFLMHCKTSLIHLRNGIDFLIQKCFN